MLTTTLREVILEKDTLCEECGLEMKTGTRAGQQDEDVYCLGCIYNEQHGDEDFS